MEDERLGRTDDQSLEVVTMGRFRLGGGQLALGLHLDGCGSNG